MFNLNKSKPNNYTNKGSMHKKTSCKQYAMQIEIFFYATVMKFIQT